MRHVAEFLSFTDTGHDMYLQRRNSNRCDHIHNGITTAVAKSPRSEKDALQTYFSSYLRDIHNLYSCQLSSLRVATPTTKNNLISVWNIY